MNLGNSVVRYARSASVSFAFRSSRATRCAADRPSSRAAASYTVRSDTDSGGIAFAILNTWPSSGLSKYIDFRCGSHSSGCSMQNLSVRVWNAGEKVSVACGRVPFPLPFRELRGGRNGRARVFSWVVVVPLIGAPSPRAGPGGAGRAAESPDDRAATFDDAAAVSGAREP